MRSTGLGYVGAVLAFGACVEGPHADGVVKHLEGSYGFEYTAPDGSVIREERDETVFMSRDTVPECCFGVAVSGSTLRLHVGTHYEAPPIPIDGVCPTVVSALVQVEGVSQRAGHVEIPLDATNARLLVFTKAPTSGLCARSTNYQDAGATSREATITGHLKLDDLHCLSLDSTFCGLVGRGAWAFKGVDGAGTLVVSTHGEFVSSDSSF